MVMTQNEYRKKAAFVSKLGLRLHQCGAASSRIELHLIRLCELLGIHGAFLYAPTSFTFCYWLDDPADQLVQVERMKPSGGDLGSLERVDALVSSFEDNQLSFEQMCEAFESEGKVKGYYSKSLQCAAWMVGCVCFASIFSFNLVDGVVSGAIAVCVYLLTVVMSQSSRFSATVEVIASVIAGLLASGIAFLGVNINVPLVVLSSVIVFVPGLSLTVALSEIAERDLVSGTSKLVDAIMVLFKLYIGALLGIGIGEILWPHSLTDLEIYWPLTGDWKVAPLLVLLSLSVLIVLNIRIKLAPWCMASSLIGFLTAQYAGAAFGTVLGMFLGAFAVGVYSNWFSNLRKKPASIALIQGLIVLVPGSKSYMVLNTWITGENILSDGPHINEAFLTFISLVIGLLLANAVLPSRKSL